MSDNPEPLAAIIAEMRASAHDSFASKLVAEYEETGRIDDGPAAQALKDDDVYLVQLADRIERAAKNTENSFGMALAIEDGLRKRDKQSTHGNAAALREALKNAFAFIKVCCSNYEQDAFDLYHEIDAALAAPARNCDRFQNWEDAASAWDEFSDAQFAARRKPIPVIPWLFAPAEGGRE